MSTANQRVKNQRQARIKAGWHEVRVWVPTKDDADQIHALAATLRAKLFNRQGIENLPGVKSMNESTRTQVLDAIANQGSTKYVTPSGPMLELLTELAKEGNLDDMSAAFNIFKEAYPSNAGHVAGSIAAKILNHYFIPQLGLNGLSRWLRWQEENGTWGITLTDSLWTGGFSSTVDAILVDIQSRPFRHQHE